MIPNASEVVRRRWTVRTGLRLVSLLFMIGSLHPMLSWLVEGLSDGDLLDMTYYAERLAGAVMLLVVAVGMYVLSGRLTRWLVPTPRTFECPGCEHRIEGLVEARCTECGLPLTREFIADEPVSVRERRLRPRRVILHREAAAAVFRVAGVFVAMFGLLWGAASTIVVLDWFISGRTGDYYEFMQLGGMFLETVVWMSFAGVMLFAPRRLARFCVPYRAANAATPPSVKGEPTQATLS